MNRFLCLIFMVTSVCYANRVYETKVNFLKKKKGGRSNFTFCISNLNKNDLERLDPYFTYSGFYSIKESTLTEKDSKIVAIYSKFKLLQNKIKSAALDEIQTLNEEVYRLISSLEKIEVPEKEKRLKWYRKKKLVSTDRYYLPYMIHDIRKNSELLKFAILDSIENGNENFRKQSLLWNSRVALIKAIKKEYNKNRGLGFSLTYKKSCKNVDLPIFYTYRGRGGFSRNPRGISNFSFIPKKGNDRFIFLNFSARNIETSSHVLTTLHEVGHALGLAHEKIDKSEDAPIFKGDGYMEPHIHKRSIAMNQNIDVLSVMSYQLIQTVRLCNKDNWHENVYFKDVLAEDEDLVTLGPKSDDLFVKCIVGASLYFNRTLVEKAIEKGIMTNMFEINEDGEEFLDYEPKLSPGDKHALRCLHLQSYPKDNCHEHHDSYDFF